MKLRASNLEQAQTWASVRGFGNQNHPRSHAQLHRDGVYSVMWSDTALQELHQVVEDPSQGSHMLVKAGESAGIVDIGDGLGCAFKVKATTTRLPSSPTKAPNGCRKIAAMASTMGARPIAQLDIARNSQPWWLRGGCGERHWRLRQQLWGAIVGGEVFLARLPIDTLVNAMSVGILEADKIISATYRSRQPVHRGFSHGQGQHSSASFASRTSRKKVPTTCLRCRWATPSEEAPPRGDPRAFEDHRRRRHTGHGAAGIAAPPRNSAAGEVGMDIHLTVCLASTGRGPFEILLSESPSACLWSSTRDGRGSEGHFQEVEDLP